MDVFSSIDEFFSNCYIMDNVFGFLGLLILVALFAFLGDYIARKYVKVYFHKRYFLIGAFVVVEFLLFYFRMQGVGFLTLFDLPILIPLPFSLCG